MKTVAKFELAFTRYCFQTVLARVPFSKSTVIEVCRQNMPFSCERKAYLLHFPRFQNVEITVPGVEKIADHCTNVPRNFFRSAERMKGRKEQVLMWKSEKMESHFFVKIVKAKGFIDSCH